jgi:tripartite-type tricarboxylate transporter receptor subunit TctC
MAKELLSILVAGLSALGSFPAYSQSFAGKAVNIIVGYSAGGGYDTYSRAIARHMGTYIPGKPAMVVQNMPGAGSAKAAAYIYTIAPKDGTAIGAVSPGAVVAPLLDPRPEFNFDSTRFRYLGTADSGTRVCATLRRSGISTFDEARRKKTIIGAVASGSSTADFAWLHQKTAGANFSIVAGYPGTAEVLLAMERGEVDGICGLDWSSLKAQRPQWLRDGTMNVLVQAGIRSSAELSKMNVPEIWKFIEGDENRRINELIMGQQVFGRPYILPPGTPEAIVNFLRDAFGKTLSDPGFLADAEKGGLAVEPADGETVEQAVKAVFSASPEIVAKARAAIAQ